MHTQTRSASREGVKGLGEETSPSSVRGCHRLGEAGFRPLRVEHGHIGRCGHVSLRHAPKAPTQEGLGL